MVMEKVREIKNAETKADAIIGGAEKQASEVLVSLDAKLDKYKKDKTHSFKEDIQSYQRLCSKKTQEKIGALQKEYSQKIEELKKQSAEKIAFASEFSWNDLKSVLFKP